MASIDEDVVNMLYRIPEIARSEVLDRYGVTEQLFDEHTRGIENAIWMRASLYGGFLNQQNMEKYHAVVLTALSEEMQHMRRLESETGSRVETNDLIKHFMRHMLIGTRGYEVGNSVRSLMQIGPDAVSIAGRECGHTIISENPKMISISRGVQYWETVLDASSEPAALHGFGLWCLVESVDRDTWERLMLRTCEVADGVVDFPAFVIKRASSDGLPTRSGIRIIEFILHANKHLVGDLSVSHTLNMIRMRSGPPLDHA